MKGYDPTEAASFILSHLDKKPFARIKGRLNEIIDAFIRYDEHFMRLTDVIDMEGMAGENEYDEDDAFEYIYGAYLGDHPEEDDDEDMLIATLLNRYMELQYEYLCQCGLAE